MLLLVLVPLLAIVPLAGVRVVSETQEIAAASHTSDQARIAMRVSDLVNAIGDERDLTEVALNNHGIKGNNDLASAQKNTTAKVKAYDDALVQYENSVNALPVETKQLGHRARARLGDLAPLRDSARRLGAGTPTFTAYTTVIDDLLDFNNQLASGTSDHTLSSLVSTLSSVQQLEEQTSIERGYLVDIVSSGQATLAQTEDLEQAQAQFTSAYNSITNNAPLSVVNLYQSRVSGNKIGAADGTVQAVTAAAQEGTPIASVKTSSDSSFGNMTSKLHALRGVQKRVNSDMAQRASWLLSSSQTGLYLNLAFIVVVVVLSYLGASVLARSVVRPLRTLRSSALEVADSRLPDVVRKLRESKSPEEAVRTERIAVDSLDEVGQVARAFDRVHFEAVRLATEQAMMRDNVNTMFTNLSRRSESLVLRQLNLIDELEEGEQSPTQLASLFKLDHLATRMRRNNESLLVLAGEEQGRRWNRPVLLLDVARAAAAEVEQYERVSLRDMPDVAVAGRAATDVVHLVAELIENAAAFSAPETEVLVSGSTARDGEIVIEISDSGIGMPAAELREINEKLAKPPVVDVAISRRMGLFVVGRLASKHGIRVGLNKARSGGITAVAMIPLSMLQSTSELDNDSGTAFGLARRSGAQDTLDISDILNTDFSGEPVGSTQGFTPAPLNGQVYNDSSYGGHSYAGQGQGEPGYNDQYGEQRSGYADPAYAGHTPVDAGQGTDGFTWFTDESGQGQGQGQPGGDEFDWFTDQSGSAEPDASAYEPQSPAPPYINMPAPGERSASGPPQLPAPARPGDTSDRLPIFDAMESEWFGPEHQGSGAPAQSSTPSQPAQQTQSVQPLGSAQQSPYANGQSQGSSQGTGGQGQGQAHHTMPLSVMPAAANRPARARPPEPAKPATPSTPSTQSTPANGTWSRESAAGHGPSDTSAAWAPTGDAQVRPPAAAPGGAPVTGGTTAGGLPRRVPQSNLMPGFAASQGSQQSSAPMAPTSRSAEQMKDRLSRFHQGVRHGKGASDNGDEGPRTYGSDAR